MIVTRFAPSPTGLLHLGHAYAAIAASEAGDRFVVRIEDIDAGRCKPEYETAILEDLDWLGLRFEQPVLRLSEQVALHMQIDILDNVVLGSTPDGTNASRAYPTHDGVLGFRATDVLATSKQACRIIAGACGRHSSYWLEN